MSKVDTVAYVKRQLLSTFEPGKTRSKDTVKDCGKRSRLLGQLYPHLHHHNDRVRAMDRDHPGWRGYPNPVDWNEIDHE
ncbi:MAG: hypothetical protein ACFB2W_00775 [Leptolyngbyaceae cyanobacterium]